MGYEEKVEILFSDLFSRNTFETASQMIRRTDSARYGVADGVCNRPVCFKTVIPQQVRDDCFLRYSHRKQDRFSLRWCLQNTDVYTRCQTKHQHWCTLSGTTIGFGSYIESITISDLIGA